MNLPYKSILFYLTIACLLTPFLVSSNTYFPFIVTKATIFRILVEVMALLWVLMIVKGETKLKLNGLFKVLLVYALVILISALLGVNFYWSFFSGNERMEGVFGIWHFILFFFIIASVFDLNDFKKVFKAEVFISAFYGFLALIIYAGGRIGVVSATPRLSGFTGNPSYLGIYFIFNSLLALYFYLEEFKLSKKIFNPWLLLVVYEALLIFISGTRGGMIGFGLGFLYIITSLIFSQRAKEYHLLKKLSLFTLIAGIVFLGAVFSLKNTSFVKNNFALERLTSISLKDPTGMARLLSAQTAFKSFKEKPFFGWGPENYEPAYLKNFNPEVVKVLPGDFYFDRAHNKPMEVLATTGIFGLISYLLIFVAAFWILEQTKKKEGLPAQAGQFLFALVFEAILIGYFIQNVFIFDFHESYLMFFLVLGFISVMGDTPETSSEIPRFARNDGRTKDFVPELTKGLILIVSFCLIFYSLSQFVIKPYSISKNIITTIKALTRQDYDNAYQLYKKNLYSAGQFENLRKDIVIGIENAFANYVTPSENLKPFIDDLISETDKLLQREPWNYRLVMNKAQLQLNESMWDKEKIKEAEKTAEDLVKIAPAFPQTHLLLAKIYFLENDLEKAKEEAEKVLSLNPQDSTAYYILGLYYSNKKDNENANKYFVQAARYGYLFKDKNSIVNIANLLIQEKDYETIIKLYLQAINLDSKDTEIYVHLAAAYGKIHDKEKAIYYAQKAAELDPNFKQASENFIQLIENGEWDKIPD
jgi:O-antigen ligase/tetratricopeptide (TPR) repeat protein